MTWLALLFAAEIGIAPYGAWAFYAEPAQGYILQTQDRTEAYTQLEAEVRLFDVLSWRSTVTTWVRHYTGASYAPVWATYDSDLGAEIGPVRIGWRHSCTHPIQPYVSMVGASVPELEGGFGQIYVRYQMEGR